MTTHLDLFTPDQRAALDLLRETIRKFAMADFDEIHVPDPLSLARALVDALTTVASDPALLQEAARQMYVTFNLADADPHKRAAALTTYHSDAGMAQWTVIALDWIKRLAMSLADRTHVTQH
jgi:hypothetical protein